jgi:hypothetical protein
MTITRERVAGAATTARPYVERALRDEELRDNIRNAYASARIVYEQLSSRRKVSDAASRLAGDKDVQFELLNAVEELRSAANRVQAVKDGTSESGRTAKQSLLLFLGIAIGILLNPLTGPPVRRALARTLFGSGDGFVYQGNGSGA